MEAHEEEHDWQELPLLKSPEGQVRGPQSFPFKTFGELQLVQLVADPEHVAHEEEHDSQNPPLLNSPEGQEETQFSPLKTFGE